MRVRRAIKQEACRQAHGMCLLCPLLAAVCCSEGHTDEQLRHAHGAALPRGPLRTIAPVSHLLSSCFQQHFPD